jgi:hypothetical protein
MWMFLFAVGLFLSKCDYASCNFTLPTECRSQQLFPTNNLRIFCDQFSSWSELNKYFSSNENEFEKNQTGELYSLKPSSPLLLTNQLNMTKFTSNPEFPSTYKHIFIQPART